MFQHVPSFSLLSSLGNSKYMIRDILILLTAFLISVNFGALLFFFFFALEIRRGNQAIWFCFLFFLFLLHSSVKRTAQPHEWMILFRSEHRRKQGEMSPNGCCLCYCYINPNLGLFLRSPHFLMSLDSLCLDTFQSRNFEKGYSCSYWIARAKKRPYLFVFTMFWFW